VSIEGDDSAVVDDVPPRRLKGEEGALGVDREEPVELLFGVT
jgi:hypothetical protein